MVGSNILLEIHKRLQQIKSDSVFGGVSILAVGGFVSVTSSLPSSKLQCSTFSDCYAQLCGSGLLWADHFLMHELTKIMGQRDDLAFSELLCCVKTNSSTADDIRTHEIAADIDNYPTQVLHVYRLNADVDTWNTDMLNSLVDSIPSKPLIQ